MRFLSRKCTVAGLAVLVGLSVPAMTGCTDADLSTFLSDLQASLDINVNINDNTNGGGGSGDGVSGDGSSGADGSLTDDTGGGGGGEETRYATSLSGIGSASGSAAWRVRTDRVVFKVEVESGLPGAVLDIVVDGVTIAALTLDATGFGEVEYQDPPDNNPGANELPLPNNFPADVGDGSTVSVGDLSGVLSPS